MRSTLSRWRRLRISNQSRHSARTVLTKRSAIAFAFGARTGVFTIRMPSLRNTSSKGPLYLLSRSRIRNRTPWSEKSRPRLRAFWVTQAPVGFAVQPASQTRRLPCAMSKQSSIRHSEVRPHDLAAQDLELVAQHQQLEVFHMQTPTAPNKRPEQSPHGEIEKRESH